ncbi:MULTISPECIES: NAD(P)H-dependent oxidoreductase [Clostridia]|uniref:NAD(P)H-dependent oxidoreductase n=1 Tax=Clostridia TaxID=186801 RepID=UPI000EA37942|nr:MULTISPECIES: NAD(P)H-dependent oxidoreductase [Clostridia]NBJ68688.1 NADPH-dependent oxidoreductase [Roseburia sp. 1XD42-34]RKI80638.1 NADPH-dependent oxidoreductase [Clostridium sp. 1xD42-85]
MKLVGIVGSNAELSYNRILLKYIAKQFSHLFEMEVIEIKDVPLFNQSDDQTNSPAIQRINNKIMHADGVIIATPEHNHTIPAGLKSLIEWLSFKIHPLENKPVMIVGASYYAQGSSRAQLHLRQILDAPGVNAIVMPGNEFLLGKVKEAFDEQGNLKDQGTQKFLESILQKFVRFVKVLAALEGPKKLAKPEDLHATGKIDTTIEGVDMAAEDWVEKAAEAVDAVEGKTYVKLDRGILTVDQLNYFLASMPMELTYADSNNQFLYYNHTLPAEEMLASRTPGQVGNPLADCHPLKSLKNVEWVIQQLRSGAKDAVRVHVPTHGPDKYVVHNYQAMHDKAGNYVGINEFILDFKPIIDWYLKQTGQKLVGDVDAVSGASANDNHDVDGVSGATANDGVHKNVDTVSSTSVNH